MIDTYGELRVETKIKLRCKKIAYSSFNEITKTFLGISNVGVTIAHSATLHLQKKIPTHNVLKLRLRFYMQIVHTMHAIVSFKKQFLNKV